ncbi:MAG: hypothetical protein OK452_10555 [Thaumarchaeota archaeon]|nr:hypothetical protein [Nitrososphaerota archaeon]
MPISNEGISVQEIRESFDALHLVRYGHKMKDPLEIVNLRAKGTGALEKPVLRRITKRGEDTPKSKMAYCMSTERMTDFAIFRREALGEDDRVEGPAIIDEGVARTVLHTGQKLRVDMYGNLRISA